MAMFHTSTIRLFSHSISFENCRKKAIIVVVDHFLFSLRFSFVLRAHWFFFQILLELSLEAHTYNL